MAAGTAIVAATAPAAPAAASRSDRRERGALVGTSSVIVWRSDAGNVRADYANGINAADGFLYSVRTFDHDSSLFTARGWDDVTGLGTVTSRYITQFAAHH